MLSFFRMNRLFQCLLIPFANLHSKLRNLMRKLGLNIVVLFVLLWLLITLLVIFSNVLVLIKYYSQEVRITTKVISVDPLETILKSLNMLTLYSFNDCEVPTTSKYFVGNNTTSESLRKPTTTNCYGKYTLIILVTSNISNFNRRSMIRQSWGNHLRSHGNDNMHSAKIYFLVGRPAASTSSEFKNSIARKASCESEMFRDLVFVDVHENFSNITYKLQHGFKWALRACSFHYILSVHDDAYVNVPRLFDFLFDEGVPRKRLYSGKVQFSTRVLRTGKYGVSKDRLHKNVYARYCSGAGFVVSRDTLVAMASRFDRVKPFAFYDAYFGELALKSGIDSFDNEDFRTFEKEEKCRSYQDLILFHPVNNVACMMSLLANQILKEKKKEPVQEAISMT